MFVNSNSGQGNPRPKNAIANTMQYSDPNFSWSSSSADDYNNNNNNNNNNRNNSFNTSVADTDDARNSADGSPIRMSPWNNIFPFHKSNNWSGPASPSPTQQAALVGSLVREEGHIYSLATKHGDLLYTGSDSKNIHVWKNLKGYSCFKSTSGLVKAIVIAGEKIFTGHQDGKIRVWKVSNKDPSVHKRYGSLPTLKDVFKCSMRPSNYIEVKRRRSVWIRHSDAISCLSLVEEQGLLYSASWDRTVKVWRISDSKCLESIPAHEDAVNSVVTCTDGVVFTGSADGTVKVWRREVQGKVTKHLFMETLLKQECAVTALAVDPTGSILYCGSSDGLLNFWYRGRGLAHGGVLRGHKLAVLCLVARGRLVFSGSADKNVCVWRREGAEHVHLSVLTGHTGPVKCLAVEEDREKGRWKLYSGSLDKSVRVWSVADQAQVGMVQQPQQPQMVMEVGSGADSMRSNRSFF